MSRWDGDDRDDDRFGGAWFPASKPIQATGGIKAGSRSGAFGKNWWAKRWISVLESFSIGGRLQRGRSYARQGQVLNIDVQKGVVLAEVQGSRPRPYSVTIRVETLPEASWKKVGRELSKRALFAAKLLGGEMPQEIESVLAAVSVPLFPQKAVDLRTACTCPDVSNPCKHIAAVYYLLGEEFDRDPFLLFRVRGLERQELFDLLSSSSKKEFVAQTVPQAHALPVTEPLPADPAGFWEGRPIPAESAGLGQGPVVAAALPKRLGHFPFWRGERPFLEVLDAVYRKASDRAAGICPVKP